MNTTRPGNGCGWCGHCKMTPLYGFACHHTVCGSDRPASVQYYAEAHETPDWCPLPDGEHGSE